MEEPPHSCYQEWRQGDASLTVKEMPVIVSDDGDADFIAVEGIVMLSQTCDIVRRAEERSYVQVAALVKVTDAELDQIRKYQRPRYIYVPQCAAESLVGDLDLVVTMHKSICETWKRLPAPLEVTMVRDFGYAAGRHRSRSAFPDRWAIELDELRSWLRSKSTKASDEGKFASAVEQVRIIANDIDCPSEADIICIIPIGTAPALRRKWIDDMIPKMSKKIDANWGCSVSFRLATTAELTAHEYLESRRLDFDALSRAA